MPTGGLPSASNSNRRIAQEAPEGEPNGLVTLDFADVESVVQHADLILYVVQNRLGIRQADRDFLRRLSGLADRVQPVLNVEGFSPMASDAMTAPLPSPSRRTVRWSLTRPRR